MTSAEKSFDGEPTQLTHCEPKDDAMHARMAVDAEGRLWTTYYRWERIRGISRDKEIYARYLEKDRWSDEIHVSPTDVPVFEDHTDPVIAAVGDGVAIGWSWDFHRQNSCPRYSRVPDTPSIFLRKVEAGPKLGRIRAVSGANVDTRPTLALGENDRLFCAWESATLGRSIDGKLKLVAASVENLEQDEQPGVGVNVTGMLQNVCTPCLAANHNGQMTLVWAEPDAEDQWILKAAQWDDERRVWGSPKTLIAKGNPRFPAAAYDKSNRLWIAHTVDRGNRREVAVFRSDEH